MHERSNEGVLIGSIVLAWIGLSVPLSVLVGVVIRHSDSEGCECTSNPPHSLEACAA